MTNDNANTVTRESEPLEAVLARARKGESITRGMGPFFIALHWETGKIRICPIGFNSVEEAVLYFAQRAHGVEPGGLVTICFRLHSQWLQ